MMKDRVTVSFALVLTIESRCCLAMRSQAFDLILRQQAAYLYLPA